jgi:putative transposase
VTFPLQIADRDNILSKDVLKGGVWKSTHQLTAQMLEYIETYNKTKAKPFAWTYTGDAP